VALGCLVLCGWAFHRPAVISVIPGFVAMKANAALALFLSGISLWLLIPGEPSPRRRGIAFLLASLVEVIGLSTLSEYVLGLNLCIDQLLFHEPAGTIATSSGRMAPVAAFAFVSIGASLILLGLKAGRGDRAAQGLSLLAALAAMIAVIGYIDHATVLYRLLLYTQLALHTAIALFLLSVAIFFARPRSAFAGDLTGEGPGSVMSRYLLPAAFIVPICVGRLRLEGQLAGLYGTELGLALFTTSNVVVFAFLVWLTARKLNKESDKRNNAESAVRELNAGLEGRVAERTRSLERQTTLLAEQAALLDIAHDSIFVRDMQNRITFWNKGAADKYGWTADEALGRVTHDLLKTEFPEPLEKINAELMSQGRWEGELVHTRADQTQIVLASRWALQWDTHGVPRAVLEINNDITERKLAEDALRLSEERLTLLVEGVKDYAIFMLDPEGFVVTWNEGAERIKGYAASEIVGQHFVKFYTPEAIAQGVPSRELKTAAEQGYSEDEGWRVRKDGSRFWANVVITPLRDKAGHLRGFGKITRDITSRKEAETKVESLSTRLSIATEAAKMGVWEWDPVTDVVLCNETMDRIYGYSPTVATPSGTWLVQTRYERFAAAIHPDDLAEVEAKLQQVIAQKSQGSTEYRIILPDGSIRLISAVERAILDETGKVTRLVGVNTDITDRQAAEDELFAEKERAQVTLKSIGDAVVCTDLAGFVSFLNPVAEHLTGWLQEEAAGRPVVEVLRILDDATHEAIPNPMILAVEHNRTLSLPSNCHLIRRDGSETPIEDSVSPIHDREGRVTGAVIVFRDVTVAKELARQMTHQAQHDFLTGLPNRMLMNDRVSQAIAASLRHHGMVAVLFLDLDGFKKINDSLGHQIGDRLLQSVAGRLRECLRGPDTVSRLGGDEFVVLLPEVLRAEDPAFTAQRIIQAIAAPHSIDGHDLHVTTCIGISVYPEDGLDGTTLIKNADIAMYHAKEHGRQRYEFFKPAMNVRAVERQSIEEDLRRALEQRQFVVYYQPQIDLRTGAITGAEALIRWEHPLRGTIAPEAFIAIAEDCGLIVPIGNWVLRESCRQARAWLDKGLPLETIAVNVSAMEFRDKHFGEGVLKALDDAGLHPKHLQLELTEGVLIKSADSTESILNALRARGIQVAIDDFGTGYSSLSYLTRFPIDILKIDQSFVHQIADSEDDTSIVTTIIGMGRNLKMLVVAEGVETQEEATFLRDHYCDQAQGYYFSRPVTAENFASLLQTGKVKEVARSMD
jgi:diguanylate cyclase (GGDEF)-like protein/PAS domain S-box-containing protein